MNRAVDNLGLSQVDIIRRVIGNMFIIDFGIIKEIVADGIVTVEMSCATSNDNIVITNCVLANFASSALSINIRPQVDDKVLVLFPRKFAGAMFSKALNEPIVNKAISGYKQQGGIAILLNQYQPLTHKNFLEFDEGKLNLNLAYKQDEDKACVSLGINEEGELTYTSNENVEVNINKEGELHYTSNDNAEVSINKDGEINLTCNNTNISLDKENEIIIDTSKAKIEIDSSGNVSINAMSGKLSLKNNITSLYQILNGMLQILNSSLATAGSPASHTVVPQQFAQQATLLGQLME